MKRKQGGSKIAQQRGRLAPGEAVVKCVLHDELGNYILKRSSALAGEDLKDLATSLQISTRHLERVLAGRTSITPELIARLNSIDADYRLIPGWLLVCKNKFPAESGE